MKNLTKLIFLFAFVTFFHGCNFQGKDTQLIEIQAFADREKNDQVAQALMYYTPAYFIHHIPSLNEENGSAVQPGYVRDSDSGISYFRIFYVLNNSNISSADITSMKKEFHRFIPVMVEQHASAWELQENESVLKANWLKEFLNSSEAEKYRGDLSQQLPVDYQDYFLNTPKKIQKKYGFIDSAIYLRYQYYKPFGDFKEQLVLNYKVIFDDGHNALVNVSLDKNQKVSLIEILSLKL